MIHVEVLLIQRDNIYNNNVMLEISLSPAWYQQNTQHATFLCSCVRCYNIKQLL